MIVYAYELRAGMEAALPDANGKELLRYAKRIAAVDRRSVDGKPMVMVTFDNRTIRGYNYLDKVHVKKWRGS